MCTVTVLFALQGPRVEHSIDVKATTEKPMILKPAALNSQVTAALLLRALASEEPAEKAAKMEELEQMIKDWPGRSWGVDFLRPQGINKRVKK